MKPDVSVIVPVYNAAEYLNQCLDSLVNQTLSNIEIILVDDGSTDNSVQIIKSYQQKDPQRIILIQQPNQGPGAARNTGLKAAQGKTIGFVDSDDYVELEMFEKLYQALQLQQADGVWCNYWAVKQEIGWPKYRHIEKRGRISSIKDNPKMLYQFDFGPCNKLYRAELWKDIWFPEDLKYEDVEAGIKVFSRANHLAFVPDALYNYRLLSGSETRTYNARVFDMLTIIKNLWEFFPTACKAIKKALTIRSCGMVFEYTQIYVRQHHQVENSEMIIDYLQQGYATLQKYCPNWRVNYLIHAKNLKNFFLRLLQSNQKRYTAYCRKRIANE